MKGCLLNGLEDSIYRGKMRAMSPKRFTCKQVVMVVIVVILVVDVTVADDNDGDGGEQNEGSSGVIANCILLTSSYTPAVVTKRPANITGAARVIGL
jgi:hypothetical protein